MMIAETNFCIFSKLQKQYNSKKNSKLPLVRSFTDLKIKIDANHLDLEITSVFFPLDKGQDFVTTKPLTVQDIIAKHPSSHNARNMPDFTSDMYIS